MPDIPAEPSPSELGTPGRTGGLILTELKEKGIPDLNTLARDLGVQGFSGLRKQDLIFKILKERVKQNGLMFGEGPSRSCPTASASCAPRTTTTSPAPTTSTSRPARSAVSA